MDTWDIVDRESWMNVLPGTWAFKVKRFPNGDVKKLKARFCARGDKQIEGVDYFDTFAPVVSWTTVRLLLILSAILNLNTRQVDYTAAFVHAPIDRDPNYDSLSPEQQARQGVYVDMPQGFSRKGKVLRLKKSLYGLKQSPRNFFQHLKSKLESVGFHAATDVDSCLFISDKVICLCYVDDTLLFSPKQEWIDEVIDKLRQTDLSIEIEDDVAGFLGVQIKRDDNAGTVTLTQTGLIDRIIDALHIEGLPPKETPADDVLTMDKEGDPPYGTFNYASVIGMMWYLYGHSRPDLGFALSQAARFSFAPKRSHELALIRIGQYLKGTRDKGLVLTPNRAELLKVDCYVDADFCGLYGREDRTDPSSVKSRTGYVICIADCPVIWSSKLQESIALSTMMAEYYALSTAMREVIPLNELIKSVAGGLSLDNESHTSFKTTVWEDNNGALTLATLDPGQHTPRSKHYDIKVHWFRSHLKPNQIEVEKIDTSLQKADIFTKPLPPEVFIHLRRLLMGW
jgi:Reverse transcriptase (RNA-dependent DNA polymerase)